RCAPFSTLGSAADAPYLPLSIDHQRGWPRLPSEQPTTDRKPSSAYAVTQSSEQAGMVIDIKGLRTYLFSRSGIVKAGDDVSFSLRRGETLAVVGESGCGKSMTALSIMRLVPNPPGKIVGGIITLEGKDLEQLEESEMR